MIYCIVDAADAGVELRREDARHLVEVGEAIKSAAAVQLPSVHPTNPGIHTINQIEFTSPLEIIDGVKSSKNAVVVSPGRLDRCPCGTGTSARMALLHARGDLEVGELFRHISILDTKFDCKILQQIKVGSVPAILPQISGRAWLTGVSYYGVDPEDPFPRGYCLGDTWFS
nr:proline racemase family protein [Ruegeria sp. Ofav3-42]